MAINSYSTEGIVISRKNYSEADRILTIYSKHFGKIRLIAKGVRKPKSRKRSSIEIFTRLKISVARTKGLDILTETEIISSYLGIRSDLKKVAVCYFFMETVEKITQAEENNQKLYELLITYINKLENTKSYKDLRFKFIEELLILMGFWPHGKYVVDHDILLENILEKKLNSRRIGKKMLL